MNDVTPTLFLICVYLFGVLTGELICLAVFVLEDKLK